MAIDDEVRRATKLLETVIQAAGLTRKDLDQKLSAGPGYVSQVLTGRMELKFRHILAILRAIEVEPGVFFQTLYPENRLATDAALMEEFLRRFQKLGFGAPPAPGERARRDCRGPQTPQAAARPQRRRGEAVGGQAGLEPLS
jgi:hypothetical protein